LNLESVPVYLIFDSHSGLLRFVGMKWILLSVFLFQNFLASAQDTATISYSKLKIKEFSLRGGIYFQGGFKCAEIEFRKMSAYSSIIKEDLSAYEEDYPFYEYSFIPDAGGSVSFQMGFNFFNRKKKKFRNTQIRAGLSYYWNNYFSMQLVNTRTVVYDSVDAGPTVTYYDSVWSNGYFMRHDWKQLNTDLSILFTTPPEKYISFAGGIGLSGGLIFNRKTSIDFRSYLDTISLDTNKAAGNQFYFLHSRNVVEEKSLHTRNKTGLNLIVSVPIQMNFNMKSQNHPFMRRIHFTLQVEPGLHLIYLPETGYKTGFNVPILAGIRFTI